MSKIVYTLTLEQVEVLQEIADILHLAEIDERRAYKSTTTVGNEKSTRIINREEFLEGTIDWCLNTLGATFEFIE